MGCGVLEGVTYLLLFAISPHLLALNVYIYEIGLSKENPAYFSISLAHELLLNHSYLRVRFEGKKLKRGWIH